MARGSSSVPAALLVLAVAAVLALAAVAANPLTSVLADPPEVSLETSQQRDAGPNGTASSVAFAHEAGDRLSVANLDVYVDGEPVGERENLTLDVPAPTFAVGDRITVEQTAPSGLAGGERVVLVYERGDTRFELATVRVEP